MSDPKDELAARRAAKGIMTITIGGVKRDVQLPLQAALDPNAMLKARAPRKRRPPENPT